MRLAPSLLALVTVFAVSTTACAPPAAPASTSAPAKPVPTTAPAKPAAATQPAGQPAAKAEAKPEATAPAKAATKPAAQGASVSFQGKTITVLVNFSAGGPTDVFGRLVARHLPKYIPGKPTMVVQNMAGAGGIIGANHLYNVAPKDGTMIGAFTSPFANQIFGAAGVEYDSARFTWLAGVPEASVAFLHKDVGVTRPEELKNPKQEIVMGGFTPDNSKDLSQRLFLNMAGVPYKYVPGYPGNADARNALLRGEINFFSESLTGWFSAMQQYVKDGTIYPVGQTGVLQGGEAVRDPNVPDVPTFQEVAIALRGERVKDSVEFAANMAMLRIQTAMLRAIVLPPGVPDDVAATMRKAVADTFNDPEFQAEAEKQNSFRLSLIPGEEAQKVAAETVNSGNPEALEYLKRLSKEGA